MSGDGRRIFAFDNRGIIFKNAFVCIKNRTDNYGIIGIISDIGRVIKGVRTDIIKSARNIEFSKVDAVVKSALANRGDCLGKDDFFKPFQTGKGRRADRRDRIAHQFAGHAKASGIVAVGIDAVNRHRNLAFISQIGAV